MNHLSVYAGLFLTALLAATILPAQSEGALLGLLLLDRYQWWLLVVVASAGNTLGSVVNWAFGRSIARFEGRRWFPVSHQQISRATAWYRRYGRWSLLLSWVPIVGDPLTVVAGVLREPLLIFILFVSIAKTGRYLALALVTLGWV